METAAPAWLLGNQTGAGPFDEAWEAFLKD